MITSDCDVIIAGGGVAGLASAVALGRMGLKCLVLESRVDRGEVDRGDILHSSAMAALSSWDCNDLLASSGGLKISRFSILDEVGQELLELDTSIDSRPSAQLFVLLHAEIEALLECAATRTGAVSVVRGERCLALIEEGTRVVGATSTIGDLRSHLVVVASGAGSPLRRSVTGAEAPSDYERVYWNLQCTGIDVFQDRAAYILGKHGVMIVAPLPRGQCRLGFQTDRTVAHGEDWAAEARRRLALLRDTSIGVIAVHRYPVSRFLASSLARPGAALVGDAAHTTHPAGAKGMNLAIRDAEVLAGLLASRSFDPAGIDDALRAYSQLRRASVRRVLRLTDLLGRAAQLEGTWPRLVRNSLLRVAGHLPQVRSSVLTRICWEC